MDRKTHIIVSCRDCGQARMPLEDVTVRGCLDDDQWSYRFTCPECGLPTVEATSVTRALDAVEIGVSVETWRYPSELDEEHDGPLLNLVDVLELHRALIEPDWFDALVRAGVNDTE
jgi:hypothetical protein